MSGQKTGFSSMLKLGVILALYAAAACVGLAFVYTGTEKIIAERQQADLDAALLELFPDADAFNPIGEISSPDPAVVIEGDKNNPANTGAFAAMKGGKPVGAALRTSRAGYGGAIKVLVGVDVNGKISGVKILEHKETPGLGANAVKPGFYGQFKDKPVTDAFVPKQDVNAITAATITSRAVAESVKAAGDAASAWLAKNAEGGSR